MGVIFVGQPMDQTSAVLHAAGLGAKRLLEVPGDSKTILFARVQGTAEEVQVRCSARGVTESILRNGVEVSMCSFTNTDALGQGVDWTRLSRLQR